MTRENNSPDRSAPAGEADFVGEVAQALIQHLDSRARLLERLEILADRKHGDRTGAILAAAKLLRATAEGGLVVTQALHARPPIAGTR